MRELISTNILGVVNKRELVKREILKIEIIFDATSQQSDGTVFIRLGGKLMLAFSVYMPLTMQKARFKLKTYVKT